MPRKTTKKPTAKKTTPKRKAYQTGGATKPMRPRTMQDMPPATGQRMATNPRTAESQTAERARQAKLAYEARLRAERNALPTTERLDAAVQKYRKERALMELGNRQRAAAARARTRSRRGPTAAEAARNMGEYERAMRARQANRGRGSTPSPRPVPQTPRPRPTPAPPPMYLSALTGNPEVDRRNRGLTELGNRQRMAAYQQRMQNRAIGRPAPQPRPVRNPVPNANATIITRQQVAERQRIQQQIAQLQARLRQLGG